MVWREYNEELVKRGEILISREEIMQWEGKTENNNRKIGAPFIYHDELILFMFRIKSTIFLDLLKDLIYGKRGILGK